MLVAKSHCDTFDKKLVRPTVSRLSAVSINRLQLSEDSLDSLALGMVSDNNTRPSAGLSDSERELSRQIVQLFSLSELVSVGGKKSAPCLSQTLSTPSVSLPSRSRKPKTATDTKNVLNLGQHFALGSGRVALSTLAEEMKLSFDREEKTRYKLVLDYRGILKSFRSSNYKFPLKLARREIQDNSVSSDHSVLDEIAVIF